MDDGGKGLPHHKNTAAHPDILVDGCFKMIIRELVLYTASTVRLFASRAH